MKIDREKLNRSMKRAALAGVGAVTVAAEKAGEIFEILVKKGEQALENKTLEEAAQEAAEKAKEGAETVVAMAKEAAADAVTKVREAVGDAPAEEACEPAEEPCEPAEETAEQPAAEEPEEEKAE